MRSLILSGLLASGAMAFSDSSPFLMYSTSKYACPLPPNPRSLNALATTPPALLFARRDYSSC